MDLETAAAELYALPPAEFTGRRDGIAKEARAEGDRDLATAVGALRKPTVAAWLVNQLARDDQGGGDDLARLEALGQELRGAQAALQGPRIKELTRDRQQLAAALLGHARRIAGDAGQQLTAAVEREIEETLTAAVADEQAALAVTSGRLTRALSYAGIGEVDLTAATATPLATARPDRRPPPRTRTAPPEPQHDVRRTPPPARTAPAKAARDERDVAEAAEAALAAAREAVATAQAALEASDRAHEEAVRHEEETSARLARLQQELAQTRRDLAAATKATAATARVHQARRRDARAARTAAEKAERDLTRHHDD